MKNFLEQTAQLWVITRGIIITCIVIWLLTLNWHQELMSPFTFPKVGISIAYLIMLCILFSNEIKGNKLPYLTRSFAGGLSILYALGFLFSTFVPGQRYFILMAIWFLFFGLYDVLIIGGFRQEE